MKNLLIILRKPPYGSSLSRLGLDFTLACAAFDQKVDLVLLGEAVLQLFPNQQAEQHGFRNHLKTLASLPLYDVSEIHVESEILSKLGIDSSLLDKHFKIIDADAISKLIEASDHVVGF